MRAALPRAAVVDAYLFGRQCAQEDGRRPRARGLALVRGANQIGVARTSPPTNAQKIAAHAGRRYWWNGLRVCCQK